MSTSQIITAITQSTGFSTEVSNIVFSYLFSYKVYESNEEFREFKSCFYLETGFRWTAYHLNPVYHIKELMNDCEGEEDLKQKTNIIISIIRYIIYNQDLIISIVGRDDILSRIKRMVSGFLIAHKDSWDMANHYYLQINHQ